MTRALVRPGLPARSSLAVALALCLSLAGAGLALQSIDGTPAVPHGEPHAAEAGGRPATIVRPLSCTPLPDVPGKSVTTVLVEFPPHAYTPAHRHPGSVVAVVVSGTVRSQMAGGPAQDFAQGQTWFEPPMSLHVFAENPSPTEPASVLATFIADDGCTGLVIPEHAAH